MWVLLLIPLVFLLPYFGSYLLAPSTTYSDLLISHLPNAIYLRQALVQYHQVPLWSPAILSGYPFAADPLSGLWYAPGWLAVLVPDPWGFNLAILIHLLWGGFGVYLLLKQEGISPLGAAAGGMLFGALPKTIAHLAAGHITLVYALSWTPWLLLVQAVAVEKPGKRIFQLGPGIVLGMMILADVRWALPAGLLWMAFLIRRRLPVWFIKRKLNPRSLAGDLLWVGEQVLLAGLIAAPLLASLWRYTSLSTRAAMDASDATILSLPPGNLLGLFFPHLDSSAEWTLYLGGIAAVLVLLSVLDRSHWKKYAFWWGLFIVSLLLAMGDNLPVVRSFYQLPGINMLRVPPRFLFLTGFAAAVLLAMMVDRLRETIAEDDGLLKPRTSLALAGFGFLLLFFSVGLWAFSKDKNWSPLWGGGMIMIAAVLTILRIKSVLPWKPVAVLFVTLLALDLTVTNRMSIRPEANLPLSMDVQAVLSRLSRDTSLYRVYSPSYSLPQEQAALHAIQLADGVDPLQLSSYRDYMVQASGVPGLGYSVTLPAYANADPEQDNLGYTPNARLLGWLSVKYVVSAFPLSADGLTQIAQSGDIYLYQNQAALPRAWVQTGAAPNLSSDRAVQSLEWTPDRISVSGNGPGELVLSEVAYPGWSVSVDGRAARVDRVNEILRGVALPAGEHQVTFKYRPVEVYWGLAGAGLGWILVVIAGLFARRQKVA